MHKALGALATLELLTRARRTKRPPWRALDEHEDGYLEDVEVETPPSDSAPRATRNGFALAAAVQPETELRVLGTIATDRLLDPEGTNGRGEATSGSPAEPGLESGGVWRVESGARLPAGTFAIVPIEDTTIIGSRRVRVERVPPRGAGIESRPPPPETPSPGTRLGPRLGAVGDAFGLVRVRVPEPFAVGVLAVGDELVALHGGSPSGGAATMTPERTAAWLPAALRAHGLRAVPLGIARDDPERLRELLVQAVLRQLGMVVLVGGIGDGVTDRTIEGLERFGATVRVRRLEIDGCERFVYARGQGLEAFALSGHPLDAACACDLFVVPALLARLGAGARHWDWSRLRWPLEASRSRVLARDVVRPAAIVPRPDGKACLRLFEMSPRSLTRIPQQEGWALLRAAPRSSQGASVRRGPDWAHFVQLAVE